MQAGELATKQDLEMLRLATQKDLEVLRLATKKDIELTKKDLEFAIEKLRYESLRFVVWTGVGVIAALGSMLAKGFHWF